MRTELAKKLGVASLLGAALLLTGCPDDDGPGGSGADATGSGDDGNSSGPGGSMSMTGQMTTADPTGSTMSGATTAGTTGTPEPKGIGETCIDPAECESGNCYLVGPLGGVCSECDEDADCADGGCTPAIPPPVVPDWIPATCNDGCEGCACEDMAACQGDLVCAEILDVMGILTISGCSTCDSDDDCMPGQLCSPNVDIMNIQGSKSCVDEGTVPNGNLCELDGNGEMACMESCIEVDISGIVTVGVCGNCSMDMDCTPPQVCQMANVDLMSGMVIPPICIDPP